MTSRPPVPLEAFVDVLTQVKLEATFRKKALRGLRVPEEAQLVMDITRKATDDRGAWVYAIQIRWLYKLDITPEGPMMSGSVEIADVGVPENGLVAVVDTLAAQCIHALAQLIVDPDSIFGKKKPA